MITKSTNLSNSSIDKNTVYKYFDIQASTPLDPRVLDSMLPYLTSYYGNPHSRTHVFGWTAENAVSSAKNQISKIINADPKEIILTSGATESSNLAIKGFAEYHNNDLHIITSQIEHKSILETCRFLEEKGVKVTYLKTTDKGVIDLDELRNAIKPNTKLVSIMAVNNELGTISPLEKIGEICKEHRITFHTDAAQGFGKTPIDVKKCNIGMMSISGHKIYGPKGIGALYVRKNPKVRIRAMSSGGGQENGLRSGTTPPFLAVGLGKASEIASESMEYDSSLIGGFRARFLEILNKGLDGHFIVNGGETIPGTLNISFPYVEGEGLLMRLKEFGLSSGSACTSASLEPSYVLRGIGASDDLAHSSIRFGFGRFTRMEDVERLGNKTVEAVQKLREMSPLYEMVKDGVDLSSINWTA